MKVNIFGTLDTAIKFLLNNPDLKVNAFIDGIIAKESKIDFPTTSYKVIPFNHAEKELRQCYTVVATSDTTYFKVKKRLEDVYGLKEFENFESCSTFRKKVVLMYGNCHLSSIKTQIETSIEFSKVYGIYPFQAICGLSDKIPFTTWFPNTVLKRCDILLYQYITDDVKDLYKTSVTSKELLSKINSNCICYCLPNFAKQARFMFPQFGGFSEKYINGVKLFKRIDLFVEEFKNQLSAKEIAQNIKTESFFDKSKIKEEFDTFITKMEIRDHQWDITVAKFLKSNYIAHQLFFDDTHPTPFLLKFVSSCLLDILGVNDSIITDGYILDSTEFPIQNSAIQALGLKFTQRDYIRQFDKSYSLNNLSMNYEEYVRQYLLFP